MSPEAQELRRAYKREYRKKNREKINRQQRKWRSDHPDKVKKYQEDYWERKISNI